MPTVTVVVACGVSPPCSCGGRSEALAAVAIAGAAVRLAVALAWIPGRLGNLPGRQAVAIEPRVRAPPSLVVFIAQRNRKTSLRLERRSPVFVVLHVSRRETA